MIKNIKINRQSLFPAKKRVLVYLLITAAVVAATGLSLLNASSAGKQIKKTPVKIAVKASIKPTVTLSLTPVPKPIIKTAYATNNNGQNNYAGFCLNVPVLMYHHIEPEALAKSEGHASLTVDPAYFDQQMQYLTSHGYQAITPDQLADALISRVNLGPKKVVLTFDDGYEDIYTYAYPIFQKYHMEANLMIPAGLLENPDYLKWSQLKEMVNSGLVNAYDHTWSHASLGGSSQQKIQFEVLTSKKELEQNLGRTVDVFVYPYGSYNSTVENILRQDGFRIAFSTIPGFWQCDSFIMNLHRTRIGNASLSAYGL